MTSSSVASWLKNIFQFKRQLSCSSLVLEFNCISGGWENRCWGGWRHRGCSWFWWRPLRELQVSLTYIWDFQKRFQTTVHLKSFRIEPIYLEKRFPNEHMSNQTWSEVWNLPWKWLGVALQMLQVSIIIIILIMIIMIMIIMVLNIFSLNWSTYVLCFVTVSIKGATTVGGT